MAREYVTMAEVARQQNLENMTPSIDINKVKITHRSFNRPQLFLAGYNVRFDKTRVQLLGNAEHDYLSQFTKEERREKYERLVATGIPGIILCSGIPVDEELIEAATARGVAVMYTTQGTAGVMVDLIGWINEQFAPTTTMHGVFVDVYGEGIIITGATGVGKSETAIELVKRGHRLVADDLIEISKVREGQLVGQAPSLTQHFVELRGIGIVDVKSLFGVESVRFKAPIDMWIDLEEWNPEKTYDRIGLEENYGEILGVRVIKHTVPIRTGRNLAIIIETAAVNNRQKKMGYNAAEELCRRVSEQVHRGSEEI